MRRSSVASPSTSTMEMLSTAIALNFIEPYSTMLLPGRNIRALKRLNLSYKLLVKANTPNNWLLRKSPPMIPRKVAKEWYMRSTLNPASDIV